MGTDQGKTSSIFMTLGEGQEWMKAGFLGGNKSGKTRTATELAIGLKKHYAHPGPIVFFDTEGGSQYVAPIVKRETGTDLIGVRARAFDDLMRAAKEAESIGASVLIVDSITHPWRELCDSYLMRLNQTLAARGKEQRGRLSLEDWNPIKAKWAPWPDWYLNSPLHVIVCGRAGDIWTREENEQTGKMESVKSGIKMKTEGEFGFEPSLLVLMEADQRIVASTGAREIVNTATILGDRFGVINGKQCENPTFEFFLPYVKMLTPGAVSTIDVTIKSDHSINADGDAAWSREKRERVILWEEIEGELARHWPSTTNADKKARLEILEATFGTRSTTKIEGMKADILRSGLAAMRLKIAGVEVPAQPKGEGDGSTAV